MHWHFSPALRSPPSAPQILAQLLPAACTDVPPAENLDDHAQEPTASKTSSRKQIPKTNTKTASWDLFARYHSEANSFPDYRAPSGKMGRGNVKALNRSGGPVNTFSRAPAPDPRPRTSAALTAVPAKVQKIESSPNRRYSTSRFFEQKHSRDNPYDLSQGGSPEDPYELRSPSSTTSSHRPHKPPAHATVPEFRSAQPRNGVSKRPRRRRQKPSYDGSIKDFGGPGSPDVLAIDNDSPPPAEIISDVVPQKGMAKRARQPSFSGPQVKRPKPAHSPSESIEVSEDELQVTSKETKDGVLKRKTNFSGLRARNSIRARSRGDIPPTEFRSSKNPNASSTREEFGIFLKEAVCGSHMWSSKLGERAKLVPQYEDDSSTKSFRLSILSSRDGTAPENEIKDGQPDIVESMPWLHLILSKFEKVERGATHSSHVCIRRRITPGAPPVLHLHFDSEGDALAFIGRIPTSVLQVTDAERLETMFHVAMTKASDRICTDGVDVGETTAPRTKLVAEIPQKLTSCETEPPKRGKLKDKMLQAHQESICQSFDLTGTPESPPPVQRTSGPETRRTRQSSPKLSLVSIPQTPEAWTVGNPDWQSQWHKSLVYPPTGKNRATVDAEDIRRLDEGQFLNDNLISFYLRYLQVQLEKDRPEVLDKVYIFSSFFFDKLKTSKNRYEGVKAWTAKVDLLSYDYIVVPVNEHAHWYLAIICNVAGALPNGHSSNGKDEPTSSNAVGARPSTRTKMPAMEEHVKSITLDDEPESSPAVAKQGDNATTPSPRPSSTNPGSPSKPRKSVGGSVQRFDPKEPKIITLDSLGNSHSPTCRILKEYLAEEAKDKKGAELAFNPSGMTGKGIPEQDNFCDCGVFVLGYMEEFLKDPDEASRRLLQKELLGWNVKPTQLRQNIRDLLFSLQKEQQERLNREREEKKQARRKMKAEANSQLPSSSATAVPPTSSQEPLSRQSLAPSQMSSPSKDPPSKESSERVKDPEMTETVPTPGAPEAATPKGRPNILDKPEPNFISRLTDGDDAPGVDDESPEMFYSAPSSPPKDEHKAKESRATSPKGSPKGRFVERIYSSGSEDKKEPKESKASIRPSVEVEDGETTSVRSPKRSKSKRPSTVSVDIEHWDSDEPDVVATKRPKYDGVKRSQE